MKSTKSYDIWRINKEKINSEEDLIILEYPFTIFIDDEEIITLLCSPKSLEYLAIGFLHSEGFIDDYKAVDNIQIDEENGRAYVNLNIRKTFNEKLQGKRTITSGCGKGTVFYNVLDSFKSKKIKNEIEIKPAEIVALMRRFNNESELFHSTGGVHACAICYKNDIMYFEEDIGRHNALDKVLGRALVDDVNLDHKIILTSGRISSEMLIKAAKRGVPVVVSRSAPTSLAIDMARELNITLVGFVRGEKMNIYSSFPSLNF